jgi:hypothetical protein
MKYIVLFALLFSSCVRKNENKNILPIYSDMGAAEDAGKTK